MTLTTSIASGQGAHTHLARHGATPNGANTSVPGSLGADSGAIANTGQMTTDTLPAMSGTTPLGGSGTALNKMPPTVIVNYILRIL